MLNYIRNYCMLIFVDDEKQLFEDCTSPSTLYVCMD